MELTLVIPAFNAADTLSRTLRSLRVIPEENRRTSVQVVVVDDGSTDTTRDIAEAGLNDLSLADGQVIGQPNTGSGAARNRAIESASGRWVYLLDADDELVNDPMPLLDEFRDRTLIACAVSFVKQGRTLRRTRPRRIKAGRHLHTFSAVNPYCTNALLLRRDLIETLFNPVFKGCEDWAFWMDNPGLFEDMATAASYQLARVHVHSQNKSGRYAWLGRYRAQIAEHMLSRLPQDAPAIIRNNFRIQRVIGQIQQGEPVKLRKSVRLPANPVLLLKLLTWKVMKGDIGPIDLYGE